jgi:hypothetical protein
VAVARDNYKPCTGAAGGPETTGTRRRGDVWSRGGGWPSSTSGRDDGSPERLAFRPRSVHEITGATSSPLLLASAALPGQLLLACPPARLPAKCLCLFNVRLLTKCLRSLHALHTLNEPVHECKLKACKRRPTLRACLVEPSNPQTFKAV